MTVIWHKKVKITKPSAGFSVIELVIVISVTMLIFLMTYDIYLVSQKSFKIGDTRLELVQNARVVLDRLTRELRQTPEIATALPPIKSEIGFPPAGEIQFQDGHGLEDIQYLRYYLIDGSLYRQRLVYAFAEEPGTYVVWNEEDEFGQPPIQTTLENKIIAEYISDLKFYGDPVIYLEIWLNKFDLTEHFYTGVWGRNTRS